MKPLSPGPTLCLSLSLTLAHLNFLVGDGNFPPAEALGGVWGCCGKMQRSGWCWPDRGHTGPHHLVTSCPMVRVRHSSIQPKTTWEPERGKCSFFWKIKSFIAQLNLQSILWDPEKALLQPDVCCKPCGCWSLSKTEKRPQESPQAWRAGWPNGSCWDNVRWYKDSPVIL